MAEVFHKDDGPRARAVLEQIKLGRLKTKAGQSALAQARYDDAKEAQQKVELNDRLDDL